MAKREQTSEVAEETNYEVKRMKSGEDEPKRDFDPVHYMGQTEYDLEKIFQEVDNGKYIFTLRSLCPGMAKTILNYKSMIFEHLSGKYNFASIQTIRRAEAYFDFGSNDSGVLPLCIQMVIQVNSRSKKEFITQALKELGFFGKNGCSPLFCSGRLKGACLWGCFKVRDKPRNCLFDNLDDRAYCHYLQTANCKYSYSAEY